ncbi:6841_t:CDS:2 [Cetraspora pellucida]|uniref:6841_t:CDS:1 n=1 Tax=Cetraspora pellucida TaxID=1433469 RepID=A0ACA9L5N1_9GLOM|nr:6841_t:CDS:2 [Cetraspora pellucida]
MKRNTYFNKETLPPHISRSFQDGKKPQKSVEKKTLYLNNNKKENIRVKDPAGVEVDLDKLLQELEAECNSIARKWPCQEKEAIEIGPCQHNRIIVKKNRQGMKIRAYEDDVTRHILLKDDAEKDEPNQEPTNNPPSKLKRFEAANNRPHYELEPPDL